MPGFPGQYRSPVPVLPLSALRVSCLASPD
ncbi:MAG: hypothetical protein ACODTL_19080 [Brucella sp.]